jgi:hypothetical protein
MDLRADRYWEVRVSGVAEPFRIHGDFHAAMTRITVFIHGQRSGDFTIRSSRRPIEAAASPDSNSHGLAPAAEIPALRDDDDWQSYYLRLVQHFDGAEDMARYLCNESFGEPQLPWLGDDKAARFVHMNASARLYSKSDPLEYESLLQYVEKHYPSLLAGLTLQG